MRKILFGAFLPLLMLSSCGINDVKEKETDSTGSLSIQSQIITDGIQVIPTPARAEEIADLYLTMKSATSNTAFIDKKNIASYPDRIIENIPVGNYEVTLASQTTAFVPAFDAPYYEGKVTNVQIAENTQRDVAIDCIQKNAGVRFIYDPSLTTAGYDDMYPVITQSSNTLEYKGNNKYRAGYFNAGSATVSFTDSKGGSYVIGKGKIKTLTLKSEQLWEITLKAEQTSDNKNQIKMIINVRTVNEPTNFDEFIISKSDDLFTGTPIFAPELFMFNFKAHTNVNEMYYYCIQESTWNKVEPTKDTIKRSGVKFQASELEEINSVSGKSIEISNVRLGVSYMMWVFASNGEKEQIQKFQFTPY